MKIVATQPEPVGPTTTDWRLEMKRAIRDPRRLLERLELDAGLLDLVACEDFPLFAPLPFVRRIEVGNPEDPLLLQLLPQAAENRPVPGFVPDPVADRQAFAGTGVIHKYPGRILLVLTGACAIHCRYCFRREFPYGEQQAWRAQWSQTMEILRQDPSLHEVILSGGDPLTLDDDAWEQILGDLQTIEHLRTVRVHTRLPVVIPSRVTDRWLRLLAQNRLDTVLVIHANHPAEIDAEVEAVLRNTAQHLTLLNQSVLLRNVNDQVEILKQLSERLLACRVIPYYLNLLDRVSGTAHFEVPEAEAMNLIQQLRESAPGYLVPRLVRDDGTGRCKRVLA